MADTKNNETTNASTGISALSILDKTGEFDWMLKISAAILYIDTAMIYLGAQSFFKLPWSFEVWASHFGEIVVGVLVYSLFVSFLLPMLETKLGLLTMMGWHRISGWLATEKPHYGQRPMDYVTRSELESEADLEQSNYLLDKLKAAEKTSSAYDVSVRKLGYLLFLVLFFLIANTFASGPSNAPSLARRFISTFNDSNKGVAVLCLAIIGLAWGWAATWCRDWQIIWIKYRPLYKKIMAEQDRINHLK